MQLFQTHAFTVHNNNKQTRNKNEKNPDLYDRMCLNKGFNLSLSLSDIGVWSHFARPRWHWTRSVVVHCLCQIPVALLYFPTIVLHPGLTAFHSSAWCRERLCRKIWLLSFSLLFIFCSRDDMIVQSQFLPQALSRWTLGRLLKKVNKPAKNLLVPVKGWDLTRPWWKIFLFFP